MGRLLMLLLLIAVVVVVVGIYRGWFHFASSSTGNQSNYSVTVNKTTIEQDTAQAKQQVQSAATQAVVEVKKVTTEAATKIKNAVSSSQPSSGP
jgi:Tfp pilus assembly protein PilN